MMRANYYITQEGLLKRDENTVFFVSRDGKRAIPVEKIYAIYAYKSLTLSSGVIALLCKHGIPVHFFGWYGNYEGSLYPKETLVSGDMTVRQVEHFLDAEKRTYIARAFVRGALQNIVKTLSNYLEDHPPLRDYIRAVEAEVEKLEGYTSLPQLMSAEGHARDAYYEALDTVVPEDFKVGGRERRPPTNKGNALLSFGNSLLYATILSEIYNTHLNPTVSFLHEPYERRFSLALDIADIFKPIIVDRVILKLVNKGMLGETHFHGELGNMLLSDSGRRLFLEQYNEKLATTIKHKGLGREVSYQRLIRLELYKLENHLLGGRRYRPLVMWW